MKHKAWNGAMRGRAAGRASAGGNARRLWTLGCVLALLTALLASPPGYAGQPEALAPEVELAGTLAGDALPKVEGRFANGTGETWLIAWSAALDGEAVPERLLWLEAGSWCEDAVAWQAQGEWLRWEYRGYRITAPMLHWVDGEPRAPEEDGYEDQQSLMEAALDADALILAPYDWKNGQAGGMRLLLPDSYAREHPGETPLDYCVRHGLLEEALAPCQNQGENETATE